MPRRYPDPCPRIFERLVLQPLRPHAERGSQRQQALLVGAHEVHHALAVVDVPMKPNAAVEGEAHPLAAAREFPIGWVYEQEMRPSVVALPTGAAAPEKR